MELWLEAWVVRLLSLGHCLGETRTARDGLTWELFRVKG